MVDVVVRRAVPRGAAVVAAAVTLGVLAFVADLVDGAAGHLMVSMVSSGLAWGLAALLAGRAAAGRRGAVTGATVLLVAATLVYYLLILVVSRRWSGGTLQDGSSADWHGLRSLAAMTAVWLLASVVGGPVLGLLGQMTKTSPAPRAALAAGVACGLLSGEGWHEMAGASPRDLLLALGGPGAGYVAAQLVEVLVPVGVLVWLAAARRLWRTWPIMLTAMILTATLGAACWIVLRAAPYHVH